MIYLNFIIHHAGGILTNTQVSWRTIAHDTNSILDVYRKYVLPMVALPLICKFIGFSLVGYTLPYTNSIIRIPLEQGLKDGLATYVLVLVFFYIFALINKKAIEKHNLTISLNRSFKLVAFSSTPVCLAGILFLFPGFSQLVIFGAAYAIYLFYQGIVEIVDESGNKAITIIVAAIGVVLLFWISLELLLNEFVRSFPA